MSETFSWTSSGDCPIGQAAWQWVAGGQPEVPDPGDRGSAVRAVVTKALIDWKLPGVEVDDVQSAVGELIANAVRHGGELLVVTVSHTPGHLSVAVEDPRGDLVPVPAADCLAELVEAEAESGRGLLLLAEFGAQWGHGRLAGGGKRVWASWQTKCPLVFETRQWRWAPRLPLAPAASRPARPAPGQTPLKASA